MSDTDRDERCMVGQAEQRRIYEGPHPAPHAVAHRAWATLVEERIRQAAEQGAFDNLPGSGKPLRIDENPAAGARSLAFSLLKANGVAPREIELAREIDMDLEQAGLVVERLRRHRDELAARSHRPFMSEQRGYQVLRASIEQQYADALRAVQRKILTLNVLAPTPLHRAPIDVDARMEILHHEFPPTEHE